MTSEVQALIRARNSAFRTKASSLYSTARANLRRGILHAKEAYRRKIKGYLTENHPRQMWRGIQAITKYKGQSPASSSSSRPEHETTPF